MLKVTACQHPPGSLLQACESEGAFADCYYIDIERRVSHREFVAAFYSTPAFKVERTLVGILLSRPSTDRDAERLADGEAESFAIWKVEKREPNQLLLAEFTGRTKSWLMVGALDGAAGAATRLFFGSAVMASQRETPNKRALGAIFYSLLWFHKLYSQVLLAAAKSKLAGRP